MSKYMAAVNDNNNNNNDNDNDNDNILGGGLQSPRGDFQEGTVKNKSLKYT